jgi:hypothetical protein
MDLTGLGSLFDFGSEILKRVWPDASEAEKAKLTMFLAQLDAEAKAQQAQIAVNEAEAANPSLFVAGWRPAVGWICVVAMGYQYIVYPLLLWAVAFWPALVAPKPVLSDVLYELLFGMLGLAGMRTWEKVKGVARR